MDSIHFRTPKSTWASAHVSGASPQRICRVSAACLRRTMASSMPRPSAYSIVATASEERKRPGGG